MDIEKLKEIKAEFEKVRKYNDMHCMSTVTEDDVLELIDEAITNQPVTKSAPIEETEEYEPYDKIERPMHYTAGSIETIDYIQSVTEQVYNGFEAVCVANAIKYISRQHLKNGKEDLKKAIWYLNRLIEYKGD